MSDLRPRTEHRSVVNRIVQWWKNWGGPNTRLSELMCCGEYEVERIAHDLGMPVSELRNIASRGPEAADLLVRRMAVLDLDRDEIATTAPSTFQDLQRVCTLCQSQRQCARDLRHDPADRVWEGYCPNVAILKLLDLLPWAARRER